MSSGRSLWLQLQAADTPREVPLTSFSILFARFKGNLAELVCGIMAIDQLKPEERILIAEVCSHHPIAEDIGRPGSRIRHQPHWASTHPPPGIPLARRAVAQAQREGG